MDKKEKIVVTGGAGFIGSHLVDALIEKGFEVHILDDLSAGNMENVNNQAVFHKVDIRDTEIAKDICTGADYVFHCAAKPRVQVSIDDPQMTNDININGTLSMLVAARDAKVKKFIYSASSSAYGDQPVMLLSEDLPANPKSPYGLQKYTGELYSKVFFDVYSLPTVCLRYFNIYGSRFAFTEGSYNLVMGMFLDAKKKGKTLTITGDGTQTRDFTHVSDVVNANILAMESDKVGKGEVINVGTGKNVSINKIAELVGGEVEYIPARLEPKDTKASNKKAKELLDWEPQISIEEGVRELKEDLGIK